MRHVAPDFPEDGSPSNGRPMPSGRGKRGWHTDWPHDLTAYGQGGAHSGAVGQPFPDVCMCLSMVWFLTDAGSESGGTWIVPGSHRDVRNPRGPGDGINVNAPIPGDLQVAGPAGSVFIQDTRAWHCQAMHNPSGVERLAVVNRWAPWWLSVQDFGAGQWVDNFTAAEWSARGSVWALTPLRSRHRRSSSLHQTP